MTQLLLTLAEARTNRDAAVEQVAGNAEDWIAQAISALRRTIAEFPQDFLAEIIRERIEADIGSPHTHKAWGALTSRAIRERIIVPTGEFRTTRSKKTHGHKTAVYRGAR
jgi:hypothetical protein